MRLVILAGGGGTRLYPLSTEEEPKQFVKIFSGKSLYQKTLERYSPYFEKTQVVTLKKYRDTVKKQSKEINTPVEIITEPARRNTLAAITLAAFTDGAPMFVTPADHAMKINDEQMRKILNGLKHSTDKIILYGIKPHHPATEYGYIQPGDETAPGVFKVVKFHEKPDKNTAEKYIKSGFLWNSGTFAITPAHLIKELEQFAPIYVEKITRYLKDNDEYQYLSLPDLSIDNGLLERTKNLGVIPLDVEWSDLGSYRALHDHLEKDANGNAIIGNARTINTKNSLIITDSETNIHSLNGYAVIHWKGRSYIGPLDDMRAPKQFVYKK